VNSCGVNPLKFIESLPQFAPQQEWVAQVSFLRPGFCGLEETLV
jgi:hypothetical protein